MPGEDKNRKDKEEYNKRVLNFLNKLKKRMPKPLRKMVDRATGALEKTESLNDFFDGEVIAISALAGAVVLGVTGLILGVAVAAVGIPVLTAWAGASLAASGFSAMGLATGSFMGLSAGAWLGAITGFAGGIALHFMPISGKVESSVKKYKINGKEIDLDKDDLSKLSPDQLSKLTFEETKKASPHRLGEVTIVIGAAGGGLTGVFTGAALGVTTGVALKTVGYVAKQIRKLTPS